jgi:hypothetical protein
MSSIQNKKNEKKSIHKKTETKKDNYSGFFKSVGSTLIFVLVWTFVSCGIITNIQYYNTSEFLKTNTYAVRKGFPLQGELVQEKGDFMDWLMNTVAMTFSKNNSILLEVLQYFNDGFSIIDLKRASSSGQVNMQNQVIDAALEKGIMSAYYLLSPLILLGMPFLGYVFGFFGLLYNGLINGGILSGDLINKFFGFIVFMFGFPVLIGLYEFFGTGFYLVFNAYNIMKHNIKLKNVMNVIKQNAQLIMFIFTLGVIVSSFQNLSNTTSIGILVGFLIINIIPIVHFFI